MILIESTVESNGYIVPLSKMEERILKKLLQYRFMTPYHGIAACSVSESKCNGGKCSSIKIIIEDDTINSNNAWQIKNI